MGLPEWKVHQRPFAEGYLTCRRAVRWPGLTLVAAEDTADEVSGMAAQHTKTKRLRCGGRSDSQRVRARRRRIWTTRRRLRRTTRTRTRTRAKRKNVARIMETVITIRCQRCLSRWLTCPSATLSSRTLLRGLSWTWKRSPVSFSPCTTLLVISITSACQAPTAHLCGRGRVQRSLWVTTWRCCVGCATLETRP